MPAELGDAPEERDKEDHPGGKEGEDGRAPPDRIRLAVLIVVWIAKRHRKRDRQKCQQRETRLARSQSEHHRGNRPDRDCQLAVPGVGVEQDDGSSRAGQVNHDEGDPGHMVKHPKPELWFRGWPGRPFKSVEGREKKSALNR